eukprot:GEMP01010477.1.p1 GENE.GEMP01010477.1~~GEMP01010477.1.p1  ORF type:complete len:735 (+),score=130.99 GEMP01010477.1:205-2409(+)
MLPLVLHAQYAVIHQDGTALMESPDVGAFATMHLPRGTFLRLLSINSGVVQVSLTDGQEGWVELKDTNDLPTIDRWDEADDGVDDRPVKLVAGAEYEVSININLYWDAPTWEGRGHTTWVFDENMLVGKLQRRTRVKLVSQPVERRLTLKSLYTSRSNVGVMCGDYGEVLVLDGHLSGEFGYIQFNVRQRPMLRFLNKTCEVDEENLAADLEERIGPLMEIELPEFSSSSPEPEGIRRWLLTAFGRERETKKEPKKVSVTSVRRRSGRITSVPSPKEIPRRVSVCREKKPRSSTFQDLSIIPSISASTVLVRMSNQVSELPPAPLMTPSRRKSKSPWEDPDPVNKKKKKSLQKALHELAVKMKWSAQHNDPPLATSSNSPPALRSAYRLNRSGSMPNIMPTQTMKSRSSFIFPGSRFRYDRGPTIVMDAPDDDAPPPTEDATLPKTKSEEVEVTPTRSRRTTISTLIGKLMHRKSIVKRPSIFRRKSSHRRLSGNGVFSPPPTTRRRRSSMTSGGTGVLLVHHKRSSFVSVDSNLDGVSMIPTMTPKQRRQRRNSSVHAKHSGRRTTVHSDRLESRADSRATIEVRKSESRSHGPRLKIGEKGAGKGTGAGRVSYATRLDSRTSVETRKTGFRSHGSTLKNGERGRGKGADADCPTILTKLDSRLSVETRRTWFRSHGSTLKNEENGTDKGTETGWTSYVTYVTCDTAPPAGTEGENGGRKKTNIGRRTLICNV